jgi:hypothetical protein
MEIRQMTTINPIFPDNSSINQADDFLADSALASRAIKNLRSGRFGSFAASIGDAANIADNSNLAKIIKAFPELFWIASEL